MLTRPEVLRNHNFRRFFVGQSVSLLGEQAAVLAIPLTAVLLLDADALTMGLLTAAGMLPSLLFSLPIGAIVDGSGRRRRTMIIADLTRAVAVLSVPVSYFFGHLTMVQLFIVAFAMGTASVAFGVADEPLLIAIVSESDFVQANTLVNGSSAASQVVGLSLGGTLVGLLTAPGALLLNAVSYCVSVYQLARIKADEPPGAPNHGNRMREGVRWVAQHGAIGSLLVSAAVMNLFAFMGNALLVLYASSVLGLSPAVVGFTFAVGAVGGVLGAVSYGRAQRHFALGHLVAGASLAFGGAMLLYPVAGASQTLSAVILGSGEFLAAVAVVWLDITLGVVFAQEIPDALRSRVAGTYRMVNFGVRPLGAVIGGVLGTGIGVRAALAVSAAGVIGGALLRLRQPVRRLRRTPSTVVPQA